jgi:hypothetical protein
MRSGGGVCLGSAPFFRFSETVPECFHNVDKSGWMNRFDKKPETMTAFLCLLDKPSRRTLA